MILTQHEADTLREIEKCLASPTSVRLPQRRETKLYPLWYQYNGRNKDDMTLSAFRGNKNPKKSLFPLIIFSMYNIGKDRYSGSYATHKSRWDKNSTRWSRIFTFIKKAMAINLLTPCQKNLVILVILLICLWIS